MKLLSILRRMFAQSKPDALRSPYRWQPQTAPRAPRSYRGVALAVMALCTLVAPAMFCMGVMAYGLVVDGGMADEVGSMMGWGFLGSVATGIIARWLYKATHPRGVWLALLIMIAVPASIIGAIPAPAIALHNATAWCNRGDASACWDLARLQRHGGLGMRRDETASKRTTARACELDPPRCKLIMVP